MNISFFGRGRGHHIDDEVEVYEDDAERLYESFNDLYDDFGEGRSKTPFVIIGALLAVAVVGGGLAFAYKRGATDGTDGPVVIEPDRTATKIEVDDPGGIDIPHQNREIFQQLAGEDAAGSDEMPSGATAPATAATPASATPASPTPASVTSTAEATVPPATPPGPATTAGAAPPAATTPPGSAAPPSGADPLTIGALASRVASGETASFAPSPAPPGGGEASAAATSAEAPSPATPDASSGAFAPRPVRTVSIGPDGSVIESSAPAEPGADPVAVAARQLAPPTTAAPGTVPPFEPSSPGGVEEAATPASFETAALTGADAATQTSVLMPSPRPKPRPTSTRAPAPAPTATPTSTGNRAATLQAALSPSTNGQRPAGQRPTIPQATTTASAPAASGGYAVQVASHRDQAEAVAAFADLQQRYPGLISGMQPLIQRADLGDRGIYYRLRIGPIASRNAADRLCSSLQDAGLPACIVREL